MIARFPQKCNSQVEKFLGNLKTHMDINCIGSIHTLRYVTKILFIEIYYPVYTFYIYKEFKTLNPLRERKTTYSYLPTKSITPTYVGDFFSSKVILLISRLYASIFSQERKR